ncbi:hypothetical protein ABC766_12890 [Methylobacterium fujisawaense]|uniref:hypothetical protein n=1 Tax=Methylobacterium fujisawaense TaxID=107400 RepID=UPI0031F4C2E5
MNTAQLHHQAPDLRRRAVARRGKLAPLLAASVAPTRGDDTERLPDYTALWARLPLPFTPAQAWHLLSPATQTEIGAALIGMALAEYVSGDMYAEEDQFHDSRLRAAADNIANDLLAGIEDRLWSLFPELLGPESDHPAWALDAGMAPVRSLAKIGDRA